MPRYEYQCAANQRRVVVRHCKSQSMQTWGDLCATGQVEAGATSLTAPVTMVQQLACGNGVMHAPGECCGGSHHDECDDRHEHPRQN